MVTMIHKLANLTSCSGTIKDARTSCTQEGTCLMCRGPVSQPLSIVKICLPAHFSVLWYLQGCMIGGYCAKPPCTQREAAFVWIPVSLAWTQPLSSVSRGSLGLFDALLFCISTTVVSNKFLSFLAPKPIHEWRRSLPGMNFPTATDFLPRPPYFPKGSQFIAFHTDMESVSQGSLYSYISLAW